MEESTARKKTSKYFAADKKKPKDEMELDDVSNKRKALKEAEQTHKPPPAKKVHKVEDEDDNDDDFVLPISNKLADTTPNKKLKTGSGRGVPKKSVDVEASDDEDYKEIDAPPKSGGRGRGGRGSSAAPTGGRGRGSGGRGGFMKFGERKDPPHKGEKVRLASLSLFVLHKGIFSCSFSFVIFVCQEVPEGAPDCLAGLTFVISGTLDRYSMHLLFDIFSQFVYALVTTVYFSCSGTFDSDVLHVFFTCDKSCSFLRICALSFFFFPCLHK